MEKERRDTLDKNVRNTFSANHLLKVVQAKATFKNLAVHRASSRDGVNLNQQDGGKEQALTGSVVQSTADAGIHDGSFMRGEPSDSSSLPASPSAPHMPHTPKTPLLTQVPPNTPRTPGVPSPRKIIRHARDATKKVLVGVRLSHKIKKLQPDGEEARDEDVEAPAAQDTQESWQTGLNLVRAVQGMVRMMLMCRNRIHDIYVDYRLRASLPTPGRVLCVITHCFSLGLSLSIYLWQISMSRLPVGKDLFRQAIRIVRLINRLAKSPKMVRELRDGGR